MSLQHIAGIHQKAANDLSCKHIIAGKDALIAKQEDLIGDLKVALIQVLGSVSLTDEVTGQAIINAHKVLDK